MDANGNPCVTKQRHDPICKVCFCAPGAALVSVCLQTSWQGVVSRLDLLLVIFLQRLCRQPSGAQPHALKTQLSHSTNHSTACQHYLMFVAPTQDVKLKDGRVIHYGDPGCSPTPPLTSNFWTSSLPTGAQPAGVHAASAGGHAPTPFSTAPLSAYTTVAPSLKGGVGVPVGSDTWLANQVSWLDRILSSK